MTAPIDKIIDRIKTGKASIFDAGPLKRFADMTPGEYDRARAALKAGGIPRLRDFDRAVEKVRKELEPDEDAPDISQQLMAIAEEFDLFTDNKGNAYANLPTCFLPVKSKEFREKLIRTFYAKTRKVVSKTTVENVLATIMANADGKPKRRVFVRVAPLPTETYVDLCDDSGQYVHIDATGWRFIEHEKLPKGIAFKRSKTMQPMPRPVKGGNIAELRPLLNLRPDVGSKPSPNDTNFILAVMWLVNCYREGAYLHLVFAGEAGMGKTTASGTMRTLTDPASPVSQAPPKTVDELMITAEKQHVPTIDNLSYISQEMSDAYCRLSTGSGYRKRMLYSDDDEATFDSMRPVIFNGINNAITRNDLQDRALVLPLAPIEVRMTDAQYKAKLDEAAPRILGALFDIIAHGMKKLPKTKPDEQTDRMATFETFGRAAEGALTCEPGTFIEAYRANRSTAKALLLEGNTVAKALVEFTNYALHATFETQWSGTATELLNLLEGGKLGDIKGPDFEPTYDTDSLAADGTRLSYKLRLIAHDLRSVYGIRIDFDKITPGGKRREIEIKWKWD